MVQNLRIQVFGNVPHPDVEALASAAGMRPAGDFSMPPMLRESWKIMVARSLAESRLIPDGSLAARIATLVTNQDPWLVWRTPAETDVWTPAYLNDFRELLERDRVEQSAAHGRSPETGLDIPATAARLAATLSLPPATVAHLVAQVMHSGSGGHDVAVKDARKGRIKS